MKTLKINSFKVALTAAAFGLMMSTGSVFAGDPGAIPISDKYQKNNALIREEVAAINLQKARINELKAKLSKDKEDDLTAAINIDKRDLCKAKADLRRSEAYLAADKTDLTRAHRLAISNRRDEVKKDKENLANYKSKLDKDIANGNEEAIIYDANRIRYYNGELNNDIALVKSEREHLNSDLAAIDKMLNNQPAQRVVVATPETAYTKTNGKYYK